MSHSQPGIWQKNNKQRKNSYMYIHQRINIIYDRYMFRTSLFGNDHLHVRIKKIFQGGFDSYLSLLGCKVVGDACHIKKIAQITYLSICFHVILPQKQQKLIFGKTRSQSGKRQHLKGCIPSSKL